jgi:cytochrome c556
MKRLVCVAGVLAVLALAALVLSPAPAEARKDLSAKEIMVKAHKGNNSLLTMVRMELREDEPDWADVQTNTREMIVLGNALCKTQPPLGDKASWDQHTRQYVANVKVLDAAAQRKDKSSADAALKKLLGSCGACHEAHRPKE